MSVASVRSPVPISTPPPFPFDDDDDDGISQTKVPAKLQSAPVTQSAPKKAAATSAPALQPKYNGDPASAHGSVEGSRAPVASGGPGTVIRPPVDDAIAVASSSVPTGSDSGVKQSTDETRMPEDRAAHQSSTKEDNLATPQPSITPSTAMGETAERLGTTPGTETPSVKLPAGASDVGDSDTEEEDSSPQLPTSAPPALTTTSGGGTSPMVPTVNNDAIPTVTGTAPQAAGVDDDATAQAKSSTSPQQSEATDTAASDIPMFPSLSNPPSGASSPANDVHAGGHRGDTPEAKTKEEPEAHASFQERQQRPSPLVALLGSTRLQLPAKCRRIQDLIVLTTRKETLETFIREVLHFMTVFPFEAPLGFFTLKQLFLCHPDVIVPLCLDPPVLSLFFRSRLPDGFGADLLLLFLTYKTSYIWKRSSGIDPPGRQETAKLLEICQKRAHVKNPRHVPPSELRDWICRIWLDLPRSRLQNPSVLELCLYWICDETASVQAKQPVYHVLRHEVQRLSVPGAGETWLVAAVLELIAGTKGCVSRDLQHVLLFMDRNRLPTVLSTLFRSSRWTPGRVLALWKYLCVYAWGPELSPDFLRGPKHTYGEQPLPLYDLCAAFVTACTAFRPVPRAGTKAPTNAHAARLQIEATRYIQGGLVEGCIRMLAAKACNPINAQHTLQLVTHILVSGFDPLSKSPHCRWYVQSLVPFFERLKFLWTTTRTVSPGLLTLLAHVTQLLHRICEQDPPRLDTKQNEVEKASIQGPTSQCVQSREEDEKSRDAVSKEDHVAVRTPFSSEVTLPSKYLPYTESQTRRRRTATISVQTEPSPNRSNNETDAAMTTAIATAVAAAVAAVGKSLENKLAPKSQDAPSTTAAGVPLGNVHPAGVSTGPPDPFTAGGAQGYSPPGNGGLTSPAQMVATNQQQPWNGLGDRPAPTSQSPFGASTVGSAHGPQAFCTDVPTLRGRLMSSPAAPFGDGTSQGVGPWSTAWGGPKADHGGFGSPQESNLWHPLCPTRQPGWNVVPFAGGGGRGGSAAGIIAEPLPQPYPALTSGPYGTGPFASFPEPAGIPFLSGPAAVAVPQPLPIAPSSLFFPNALFQNPWSYPAAGGQVLMYPQFPAFTNWVSTPAFAPPVYPLPPFPQQQQTISPPVEPRHFSPSRAEALAPSAEEVSKRVHYLQLPVSSRFSVKYELTSPRCGLTNLGNTCYLNAFLQSLFLCNAFVANLFRVTVAKHNAGASTKVAESPVDVTMLKELQILFGQLIRTQRDAISPRRFLDTLPDFYRTGQQQDSTEVARHILSSLGGTSSKLIELVFGGQTVTKVACRVCARVSERPENITDFGFPIPSETEPAAAGLSVQSLFDDFAKTEELSGDNAYSCEGCSKKTTAVRWTEIGSPPVHLFVVLNRFAWDLENGERVKVLTHVEIDETISVWGLEYELYAVVFHSGPNANSGHYYTVGRRSEAIKGSTAANDHRHRRWSRFNDADVRKTTGFHVINDLSSDPHRDDRPYIVFYRCVKAPPAPPVLLPPMLAKQIKQRDMDM